VIHFTLSGVVLVVLLQSIVPDLRNAKMCLPMGKSFHCLFNDSVPVVIYDVETKQLPDVRGGVFSFALRLPYLLGIKPMISSISEESTETSLLGPQTVMLQNLFLRQVYNTL